MLRQCRCVGATLLVPTSGLAGAGVILGGREELGRGCAELGGGVLASGVPEGMGL